MVEEVVEKEPRSALDMAQSDGGRKSSVSQKAKPLNEVSVENVERWPTGDSELDRVLGGGIVPGSLVLIGGEPGIGKSTLLTQLLMRITDRKTLYISGEESEGQVRLRAERLGVIPDTTYILTETDTVAIFRQIEAVEPSLVVVDSIQTLTSPMIESPAGSVSQVRQTASEMMRLAKEQNIPVFLIGHITKDGSIAGPKVLEHMVDTVLQFEGERQHAYRLLRANKNRFGSTNELGIYAMHGEGLRAVPNPSEVLLGEDRAEMPGVAIGTTMEGNRPLLVEVQALVAKAAYGTPQRSSIGFDSKRLNMLLAVLEKRCHLRMGQMDVFLNIAGGLRIEDPAMDLAVCAALMSSHEEVSIPRDVCFAAEVGLGGELRSVARIDARLGEAKKLGFKELAAASAKKGGPSTAKPFQGMAHLEEVLTRYFK